MERATTTAELLLDHAEVDHVVIMGIAGGLEGVAVGDLLVPEVVTDWPQTRELRSTPLGDAEPSGRLVSSDEYGYPDDVMAGFAADGVLAVDMETAAFAAVCEDRGTPWTAFRSISDPADGSFSAELLSTTNPDGSPNMKGALKYMARHPRQIPALMKMGKDATVAARRAARAAARACGLSDGVGGGLALGGSRTLLGAVTDPTGEGGG